MLQSTSFDASQLKHWKETTSRQEKLWCLECTAAGDNYRCNMRGGCDKNLGRASFDAEQLKNWKKRKGRLWCKACTQKAAKRTQSKVKRQ